MKMCIFKKRKLKNGDRIKITWLPPCINGEGTKNPYIGMIGTVTDLENDYFNLDCTTSSLCGIKKCKYIFLD